ncbi:MAG: sigma-70 family RNA polymerase sigma factor [Blastocatellia bacterium]|jgi:RNA polymerase sigma-70 factor (ECF subfamily)|nr:sigma-70 family RNA polymerase sigma factor [Blastocatellia bacterium]
MSAGESAIVKDGLYVRFDGEAVSASQPDARLVARLRDGDRLAYEELISEFQPMVYGLAFRLLGDAEEARDIAQETFLKAWRHIGTFRGECSLKTWLYRMTVNQASNQRRWWRRRRRPETVSLDEVTVATGSSLSDRIASSGLTPEQDTLGRERQRMLLAALETLRHDYRAAVVLRDIEELNYEEIAIALDVPIGTVKSRIARGRNELRKRLQKMGF